MWLKFNPIVKSPQKWQFDVLGSFINPLDVVVNGSQHLHAIQVLLFAYYRRHYRHSHFIA